nr:CHC2 zinc finger domain-containing protein [Eubacterium sp. 1001713B170207_170306_E7]
MIKNYRSIFNVVREETSIVTAARFYGVAVDRHGRALCPFHNDHHPSLSFKDNRFTCFACGARGSVIDLVMQIFHISPLEAAIKLQEDFNLTVEVRAQSHKTKNAAAKGAADTRSVKQETNGTKSARRKAKPTNTLCHPSRITAPTDSAEAVLAAALRNRLADMEAYYSRIHRELSENTEKYKPCESLETVPDKYVEAMFQLPVVSYYLDILDSGTPSERVELYRAFKRKELIQYEQR